MKQVIKIYVMLAILLGVAVSCNEQFVPLEPIGIAGDMPKDDLGALEFDVVVEENSVLKVDEPITFRLTGNAHMVRFYSGEFRNDYEYHDKDRYHDVSVTITYEHYRFGDNVNHSVNALHTGVLYYSNDFTADYGFANVHAADWQTVGFGLPSAANGITDANFSSAGTRDVSHLFVEGEPLYLAFYCQIDQGTRRTGYRVRNFQVNAVVEEDPSLNSTLYSFADLGFRWVLNQAATDHTNGTDRPYVNDSEIRWIWPTNYDVPAQYIGYAISGPIEVPRYNLGRDEPVLFATAWNESGMTRTHTFTEPGQYEVVFVANNINTSDRQEIVKKIMIEIEP